MSDLVIKPFSNQSLDIGELHLESDTQTIKIFGDMEITRDHAGLLVAMHLRANLEVIASALLAEKACGSLPVAIAEVSRGEILDNPLLDR